MEANNQDLIDQYLQGTLSPKETSAFEAALQSDASLAKEVIAQREAIKITEQLGDQMIVERIKNAENNYLQQVNTTSSKPYLVYLLIAVLLATAAALAYYFLQPVEPPVPQPKVLIAAHFEPYPLSFGNRGREDALATASLYYSEEKYEQAQKIFEDTLLENSDAKIVLASSICDMELGQWQKAIAKLSSITNDPLYDQQALWYLALSYLGDGQIEKTKNQLQKIINAKSFNQDKAKALLKLL